MRPGDVTSYCRKGKLYVIVATLCLEFGTRQKVIQKVK